MFPGQSVHPLQKTDKSGDRIYMVKLSESDNQNPERVPIPVSVNATLVRLSDNSGVALLYRVS